MTTKTDVLDWSEVKNRMEALAEELASDEDEELDENQDVEALSDEHLESLAEMLGCAPDEILQTDPADLGRALKEMKYRVMAHAKYGRSGMSHSRLPWKKNEHSVGHASPHAAPTHAGPPGASKARQKAGPIFQRGRRHRKH